MSNRLRRFLLTAGIFVTAFAIEFSSRAVPVTFSSGSLIIPMDTSANGQNNGMLRAYGLVYQLLRQHVPVYWAINPTKSENGDDFAFSLANQAQDVRTGAIVTTPRTYRGGPFIIASTDAAAALPIIQDWQATAGDQTTVHRSLVTFSPTINRLLVSAPRIAILKDGNETIAFNNLNAAGIYDSIGGTWTSNSPDLLTEADVAGATTTTHDDGALFIQSGANRLPRYGFLVSMHYNTTTTTDEVVAETRTWLAASSLTHLYAQCAAITVFENAAAGHFLSTTGLTDDGVAPASVSNRDPSNPLAQLDGTFQADSGSVDSIGVAPSGSIKSGVSTLINDSSATLLQHIVMLTGRTDGNNVNGRVTYLAGHDYALDLPITSNPQTSGVRLFLNSLLSSDSATTAGQSAAITVTAPAAVNTSTFGYTITFQNPSDSARTLENLKLVDHLPTGATYVTGSALVNGAPQAPSSVNGNQVTWSLPALAPGVSGILTFQVNVSADGTYQNSAKLSYSDITVNTVTSSVVVTTRDTVPPVVSIPTPPNQTATSSTTPSFVFSGDATVVSFKARVDSDAFTSATSPFTTRALADGLHTLSVSATDAAGNSATANFAFIVDTIAPAISLPIPPNHNVTANVQPTFTFVDTSSASTPVTFECKIDNGGFSQATSPYTVSSPLTLGAHTLTVRGADAVGNSAQTSFNFTVTSPPVLTIVPGSAGSLTVSWLPTFSGCTLEQSSELSPTNWVDSPTGSLDPATISPSSQAQFFRVRAP